MGSNLYGSSQGNIGPTQPAQPYPGSGNTTQYGSSNQYAPPPPLIYQPPLYYPPPKKRNMVPILLGIIVVLLGGILLLLFRPQQGPSSSVTTTPTPSSLPAFPTTEQEAQQVLKTTSSLHRAAAGTGWAADTGTLTVYPGNCIDIPDMDVSSVSSILTAPTVWVDRGSTGGLTLVRALLSGGGTVQAPATVYWGGCYHLHK